MGKTIGTGSCAIEAWIKCTNCNYGDAAPAACSIICAADDCTNGCKYSDGSTDSCTACPAMSSGSGAKEKRARTGANPCRRACNECKDGDDCVWVAARNHNDVANALAQPGSDDEDCASATKREL